MSNTTTAKQKFVLQLIAVLIAGGIIFCSFLAVDRYHERYVKIKLSELGLKPYEASKNCIKLPKKEKKW